MIKAIKLIDYFFKFERASFRSSGGRGFARLLVIGRGDALVKERFRYRESRYRESRVYTSIHGKPEDVPTMAEQISTAYMD